MEALRRNPKQFILGVIVLTALFMAVQSMISTRFLNVYYQINLSAMCINIVLAVSLNLINGFTGQLSLGHAGFMAIGAYVSAVATQNFHLPLGLAFPLGCAAAAAAGFIIGVPTLRLKGDYLAIATLGLGEIIRVILQNIEYVGGPAGISVNKLTTWPWLFFSVVLTVLVVRNLIRSSYGRAIISVREDEVAAELMGVNTTKYKVLGFVIGAALAGLAGALYAHYFYIIKPSTFNFLKSFDILVMVVLGGLGSTSGAVIAAAFITVLNAVLQAYPATRMIFYAAVLIVVMLYKPQGLMGNKELRLPRFRRPSAGKRG